MKLWLLIALVLALQEGLSVLAVLVHAHQLHYSFVIISLIWLAVTVLQIVLGYFCGKWMQKRFGNSKFEHWVSEWVQKLERSIDSRGESIALMLVSSIISPAIAAFLASWLEISFVNIFAFSLLGDLFWYISTWATVLGAVALLSKLQEGFAVLLIVGLIFIFISQSTKKKVL